jgi:hypothetical protein
VVEDARHQQARAGRDLGDRGVGGRGLDRPRPAAVPELQRHHLGERLGDLATAHRELGHGRLLEPAYDPRACALVGDGVLHARHLALVGHHADQEEAVAVHHAARERDDVVGAEERRALGADVLAAEPQPGVDVERDAHRHDRRGARRVHDVEVRRVVHHQRDRGRRRG